MAEDKKDVPAWQKHSAPTPSESDIDKSEKPSEAATSSAPAPTPTENDLDKTWSTQRSSESTSKSRADLLQQARNFLAHDEIQDATTESKISFLEEKGLTNEEIHELLGISRNETQAPEPAADAVDRARPKQVESESASESGPPPIITYPEFLLHASKPPPLVTPARALKTLYGASLIGGAIYGVSKFVLQPMFESLVEARHDLFTVTKEHLEPLNKKLEEVVSTIPPAARPSNVGHERREADDDSSVASDPAELFHRDVGIQTSPPASPSLSAADADGEKPTATGVAAKRLSDLREKLDVLLQSTNSTISASDDAKQAVKETESYLDQLRYGDGGVYGAEEIWRGNIFGSRAAGLGKRTDAVDDLKAEIRAMKGAMLSARNFPRGVQ